MLVRKSIYCGALFRFCFNCEISVFVSFYLLEGVVWDPGRNSVELNQKYVVIDIFRLELLYLKLESALYLISFSIWFQFLLMFMLC